MQTKFRPKKSKTKTGFGKIFVFINNMKMTANISPPKKIKREISQEFQERINQIISTKWKLKSIYETGIVSDEAEFKDVDVVFSHYHIYALYGNRVDKFKYKFLSYKTFLVRIEGVDVKCRIKEFTTNSFVFHVDFRNSHFIVELEKA